MAEILDFSKSKKRSLTHYVSPFIAEIPIVRQAMFLLAELSASGGTRLTEKGNIGRKLVRKFWDETVDQKHFSCRPNSEDDCFDLKRLHFILSDSNYVREVRSSLVITEKSESLLSSGPTSFFYRELMRVGAFTWSWTSGDRYPDYNFIQEGFGSLLNTLWGDRSPAINAIDLFSKTFRLSTQDGVEIDVRKEVEFDRREYLVGPITREVNCVQLRFMIRFCLAFGILRAPECESYSIELDGPFEKTQFLLQDLHDIACPLIHRH